ncbi:MAG: ABC transporter ATP-binding protein [Tissierellia bacterium]|nr:ABC transporter ATP-binding protein [Tissierellia bacterium]
MEKQLKYPFLKTIKKLLSNVTRQNSKLYFYFSIYTLTETIFPFFSILLPKLLIMELMLGEDARITHIVYIVLWYFVGSSIVGFIRTYVNETCYTKISYLRLNYLRDIFAKLVNLDYKYMEDPMFLAENGRALESCNTNESGVEGVYHKLFSLPAVILTVIILSVWIGSVSIWILLGLLFKLGIGIWLKRKVHSYEYEMKADIQKQERKKGYYYNTTYDFGYGKDIRIYNLKDRILANYKAEIDKFIVLKKFIANKEFILGFLGLLALLVSDGLLYGILISKVVHGMTIADFSMYLTLILQLSFSLNILGEDLSFIYRELAYAHDLFVFLEKDLGDKSGNKKAIENDTLEIEFRNVSFKYPRTDKYIFKNLNLTIPKGQRLAIVGVNGAGKSTLVKLITGLYKVDEGEILINGIPIGEFDRKELYSMFSVLFQEVNILAYTIEENVACKSSNIDRDRVWDVLDRVGLGNKVRGFKKGLSQIMLKIIDEKGVEFSGGESQKLAIARALYKDGNMVIMDEPTAALDALAEAEIYENFSELTKGKTAVYISHRLASTKFCGAIAFFDKEGLKEYGSHQELMDKKGEYYKMFTIQGKYYQEEGGLVETV